MNRSEQTRGPRRQGQGEPPSQRPDVSTLVPVHARESGGSARSRFLHGETRRRKSTDCMVQQWLLQKDRPRQESLDSQEREELLYTLANTRTAKKYRLHGTAVAPSKRQTQTRKPRLTRKKKTAVQASRDLHSHDPRKTRSRGRRSSTDRRTLGSTTDRPRTHTEFLRISKRLRGSG